MNINNISTLWATFFYPIMEFIFALIVLNYVGGLKAFEDIASKKIKYESEAIKINNGKEFVPIPKTVNLIINSIKDSSTAQIFVLFLLIYFFHQFTGWVNNIIQFSYSFSPDQVLLFEASPDSLAEIWTYYPSYTLGELYTLITESIDNTLSNIESFSINMQDTAEFLLVLFPFFLIGDIHKYIKSLFLRKKVWISANILKKIFRYLFASLILLLVVYFSIAIRINYNAQRIEQETYVFEKKCSTSGLKPQIDINEASERIKKEKQYYLDYFDGKVYTIQLHFMDVKSIIDNMREIKIGF